MSAQIIHFENEIPPKKSIYYKVLIKNFKLETSKRMLKEMCAQIDTHECTYVLNVLRQIWLM